MFEEIRAVREDGTEFDCEIGVKRIASPCGAPRMFTIVLRDISERKRAEAALKRQTEDLERSNRELEQFAYVASHDLQEPLRMVGSYVQLLERRYKSKLDEEADKWIQYAVDGANRMKMLINDLLRYSRVGTQAKPLEMTNCAEVLRGAIGNLRAAIEEGGAEVTSDELPIVLADGAQLMELFQNLIGNGLKFHGTEPPRVHVGAIRQDDTWLFSIRDNGIGIEDRHAERIFTIFQRLHTREEYPGTGIGLSICRKIVDRHGGRIWIESSPGGGSTFHFTWPAVIDAQLKKETACALETAYPKRMEL